MTLSSAGSRVLLAGTGSHVAGSRLPDVPAVADTIRDLGGVLIDRCGVRPENLMPPAIDPSPIELGNALTQAARQAEDVFLFHYVGHGLVSPGNKLHLATRETDDLTEGLSFRALPYSALEDALAVCQARTIVVVLDCCFAGLAHGSFGTAATDAFELASLGGAYVLAAASRDERALAPLGERYTSFTGALLTLLREGDPAGLPDLTIEGAYQYLRRRLPQRGIPAPVRHSSGQAGELVLAPNPAAAPPPVPVPETPHRAIPEPPCPYRGLEPFTADDARLFFGREPLTRELIQALALHAHEGTPVPVLGLSGTGKSSLLRAGLVPAVARGELPGSAAWPNMVLTPDQHPLQTLATRLANPAGLAADDISTELTADPARIVPIIRRALRRHTGKDDTPDERLLLVVDQFEEVFTSCRDQDERRCFIQAVCAAAEGPAVVVLGIRADFYSHCEAYPELARAFDGRRVSVRPMIPRELRQAIEGPAEAVGLSLEAGLVERLLRDLDAENDFASGALPLLSYALLLTWGRRTGGALTLAGYQATGGVWKAVTRQADAVYDALDDTEQRAARLLLLRMVSVGESTEDTRRRVDLTDLTTHIPGLTRARDQLAAARLITVDGDSAQIAHEALLRAWDTLRKWINSDRAGILVHQHLTDAAALWHKAGRDRGALYRGERFQVARNWAADHPDQLSALEHAFLEASGRGERRRRRIRLGVISTLSVLVVVSLIAAFLAIEGQSRARAQERSATARSLTDRADTVRDNAPQLALMLGIAADRLRHSTNTTTSLVTSMLSPYMGTLTGHSRTITAVTIGPTGHTVATGGADNRVILWDGTRKLGGFTNDAPAAALAFSPDGKNWRSAAPTAP